MIIRNIFGNSDNGDKSERKASVQSKFCTICQESFQKGQDDYRLAHCHDCDDNGRHLQASYWKQHFMTKKANSLSPDMARLRDKLASNKELLEGHKMTRSNETVEDRNISDIRKKQASLKEVDFGVVKAQVKTMVPSILREMGVGGKVDADLLVDLIVPIKIASPIVDEMNGRAALKSIVSEALEHLNVKREFNREALIKPHGESQSFDTRNILNEGFGRVSNNYGDRSRDLSKIAEDQMQENDAPMVPKNPDEQFASAFAPQNGEDEMDSFNETGPSADVANSEALDESGVHKLSDDESDAMVSRQMTPDQFMNEGIGTYNDAPGQENMVPDSSQMMEMPEEGIKRIESTTPDFASRQVAYLKNKIASKPRSTELFSFAGKISAQLPVQSVKLSALDRQVIESHPPISYITASYTDGGSMNWDYYKTDGGFLMVSASNAFHSKNLEKFADFVESDATFSKWASLPEELQVHDPLKEDHDVDDMAMPMGDGDNDPKSEHRKETHLDSASHDIDGNDLAHEQKQIEHNSEVGKEDLHDNEEKLLNTAASLLPHIARMFPGEEPDIVNDMAITAALNLLEKKANGGSFLANTHGEPMVAVHPHESNNGSMNKSATDIGSAIFNDIGGGIKNKLDEFSSKNPSYKPLANAVKPYLQTAPSTNGTGGNALWDSVGNIGKNPQEATKPSSIVNKAAELMNHIDSAYPTESRRTKLLMAVDAACYFAINSQVKKTAGGGGAKQFVGSDKFFNKISEQSWNDAIKSIAKHNKKIASLAINSLENLKLAKRIAAGDYSFIAKNVDGPKFVIAKSTYERLPANIEKSNIKLSANLNDFIDKVVQYLKNSNHTPDEPKHIKDIVEKPTVPGKKTVVLEKAVPMDKQRHIDQVLNQLVKSKDENSKKTLMENYLAVTPHLNDDERKKLLPANLHELLDSVANQETQPTQESNSEGEETEMKHEASDSSLMELLEVTADLSQEDFEMSVEALLDMGYSEGDILVIAEHRFTDKEDDMHDHIKDSEEKSGKSEKESDEIAWATVQKRKNEKE